MEYRPRFAGLYCLAETSNASVYLAHLTFEICELILLERFKTWMNRLSVEIKIFKFFFEVD
jgi:hypothetical protein